jgi:hypothetical protein
MPFSFLLKLESFGLYSAIVTTTSGSDRALKLIAARYFIEHHLTLDISLLQSRSSSSYRRLSFLGFNIVRVLRSCIIEFRFELILLLRRS